MATTERFASSSRWSTTLAVITAVVAASVLVFGWVADIDAFRRIRPDFAAMVPSTTVCFLLLSLGLLILGHTEKHVIPLGCAFVAGLIAAIDLVVLLGTDLDGIDSLLFFPLAADDGMAFATATSVLLASYCLTTLAKPGWLRPRWFEASATIGLLAALVALVGHAFDTRALYGVFVFTAMALHTALLFALLFAALLLAEPRNTWIEILLRPDRGSVGARRLLPIVALLPVLFSFLALQMTEAGLFDANFRLSLLAIAMTALASAAVLRNAYLENKAEQGRTELLRDLERTNAERALLLKELYHRVKNNLQQINAMLRIEARQVGDERLSASFNSISQRVTALGIVHQLLISSTSPSEVEVGDFLSELCDGFVRSHDTEQRGITLRIEADPGPAHIEVAVSMGLLGTELVTNAIKHAFSAGPGSIVIEYRKRPEWLVLRVSDDGSGKMDASRIAGGAGTGSLLIRSMVAQLKADLIVTSDHGTQVEVRIPPDINEQDRYE